MRNLMSELGYPTKGASVIYCDNQATLKLLKRRCFHSRTKHIQLRCNFIRERTDKGEIRGEYIPTKSNCSDCMTKAVTTS